MSKSKRKTIGHSSDFTGIRLRYLSLFVAQFFNTLGISPNAVTLFRFFVLVIGSAICFFVGGYLFNLLGLSFLSLNFFLDLVDGDLARNYNKKSRLGAYLDNSIDSISVGIISLSIVANLFLTNDSLRYFGLLALSGQTLSNRISYIYRSSFNTSSNKIRHDELRNIRFSNKNDLLSFIVMELLTPRYVFSSLFSTVRYYLVVGAIFNILNLMIAVYSIAIVFRCIFLFFMLALFYSKPKLDYKIRIFKTFRKIETANKR